jgi:thiol-disulfide isomerase/thioredoxin
MRRRDWLKAGLGAATVNWPVRAAVAPPPPEFAGLGGWLNTGFALSTAGLRGKVVLVDFWTFSCINCRRTVPYLNRWQAEYGPRGLQVIGIHTPEFHFEHVRTNLAADVEALGIHYPVAQDNAFQTWKTWGTQAWPTFYLLDQQGRVVLKREGEGFAHEMEGAIRGLLGLAGEKAASHPADDPDLSRIGTPEIYFGGAHPSPQDRAQSPRKGLADYALPQAPSPRLNTYASDGSWERDMEPLILRSARGAMRLRFAASKMHLVASAPKPTLVQVMIDDEALAAIEISRPTLYTLFDSDAPREHRLDITVEEPGLTLFSATFG